VWSYDFVKAMTHDGRALRILVLIDEYTRECLEAVKESNSALSFVMVQAH
jgi:putative transposase